MKNMAKHEGFGLNEYVRAELAKFEILTKFTDADKPIEDLYSFALMFETLDKKSTDRDQGIVWNLYEDVSKALYITKWTGKRHPERYQTKGMNDRRLEWIKTNDWFATVI